MGEFFAAGYEVLNRYHDAKDRNPAGFAVVTAAIEWRRAGMLRPIEQPVLHTLASCCLSAMRTTSPMTAAQFDEALAWACQPPVPLLIVQEGSEPPAFAPFDLVLESVATGAPPVADWTWAIVRDELRPEDGLSVGRAALRIRPDIAIRAFGVAAQASGPAAATAAFDLGELLEQRGEKDVFAAYLRAIDAACADEPMSALVRGLRHHEQGEVEDAGRAYRRAIDSNDVNATPMAMFFLGLLYEEQGDVEKAHYEYARAIELGHADATPMAWFNLGVLLEQQGDVDGARHAYQSAINSGHPDQAPKAWFNLGVLLEQQGDVDGARHAYQSAIDSGHLQAALLAKHALARLDRDDQPD